MRFFSIVTLQNDGFMIACERGAYIPALLRYLDDIAMFTRVVVDGCCRGLLFSYFGNVLLHN